MDALEFLLKGRQTELRTPNQNCEQALRKLRSNANKQKKKRPNPNSGRVELYVKNTKPIFYRKQRRPNRISTVLLKDCNPADQLQGSLGPFGPECPGECPRECPRKPGVSDVRVNSPGRSA